MWLFVVAVSQNSYLHTIAARNSGQLEVEEL